MEALRVFVTVGPPGTGKTTWMADRAREAAARHGARSVLITSLTRAAAAEIGGRGLPIPRDRIGTLHSHAYRALGFPKIAETKKHLKEFGKDFPMWRLSRAAKLDLGDAPAEAPSNETNGDKLFRQYKRKNRK